MVAVVTVVVVGIGTGVIIALQPGPARPVGSTCTFAVSTTSAGYWITPDQAQNATTIAVVGVAKGLPEYAVTIALATAMQESKLLNLDYGDQDSLGLFQQRPSEGWGTPAEILNPVYAATQFYDHLTRLPGWQSMTVAEAAQAVQISADGSLYAQWGTEAADLAKATTGEIPAGLTCELAKFGGANPPASELLAAATTELGPNPFTKPSSVQVGWQQATWAVAHAYNYHLTSITYRGQQWAWDLAATSWAPSTTSNSTSSVEFTKQP